MTKVIEKHVKKIILDHLTNYAPISPRQWGFMETRSTISALIKVVDDWSRALDQGKEVCVVFFELSKGFDKVPHLSLLQQMEEVAKSKSIPCKMAERLLIRPISGCSS